MITSLTKKKETKRRTEVTKETSLNLPPSCSRVKESCKSKRDKRISKTGVFRELWRKNDTERERERERESSLGNGRGKLMQAVNNILTFSSYNYVLILETSVLHLNIQTGSTKQIHTQYP